MVIESQKEYRSFIKNITKKDVSIVFVRDDFRNHPAESEVLFASVAFQDKNYHMMFNHSEAIEKLDYRLLSRAKRIWTDDSKQAYHLTKFKNLYDVRVMAHVQGIVLEQITEPGVCFGSMYERITSSRNANFFIPVVKLIEYAEVRLKKIQEVYDRLDIRKYHLKYNNALMAFAKVEEDGIKIKSRSFNGVFKDDFAYSNYNIITATCRPSNTFRGINLGALNKKDGTRKNIRSRFDKGILVEFDYDAYHLRLLANILKYNVPSDISLHQHLADTVYNTSYEESKRISWQILYGNLPFDKKKNPFFAEIEKFANLLQNYYRVNKCFKSPIYKKLFNMESVTNVNKNKLLNYFVQSYETERNIETIKKISRFIKGRSAHMVLYMYDSFLFDLDRTEGSKTILGVKEILQDGIYPVKIHAGLNYDSMQDITERINEIK
jgi:hypothetical protein